MEAAQAARHVARLRGGGAFLLTEGDTFIGWLCIGFFGSCGLTVIVHLLPGSSFLKLTSQGMEIRSLYRDSSVRWSDVQDFQAVQVPGRVMVGWNYSPSYTAQARGREVAWHITGIEAGLPDTYGMSPEALVALLTEWRARHASARSHPAESGRA